MCFCILGVNKYFDPAHINTAFRLIQGLSASENEAEQRLLENCRRAGLRVHGHTPADGNCFFHAVADQLSLLGLPHQSAAQLRNDIIHHLRYHPEVEVRTFACVWVCECVCVLGGCIACLRKDTGITLLVVVVCHCVNRLTFGYNFHMLRWILTKTGSKMQHGNPNLSKVI